MKGQPTARGRRVGTDAPPFEPGGKIHRRALLALLPAVLGASLAGCANGLPVGLSDGGSTEAVQAQATATAQPSAAARSLAALSALLAKPVVLSYLDRRWVASAADLGLSDAAGQPTGSGDAFVLDEVTLAAYLAVLAKEIDRAAVDARLSIGPDLAAGVSSSKSGLRLDAVRSAERVRSALRAHLASENPSEASEVELFVEVVPPKTTEADLVPARHSLEKALSSPLTLRLDDRTWKVQPRDFARALAASPPSESGLDWLVTVADEPFKGLLAKLAPEVARTPVDARIDWNGGKLKVIRESKEGRQLDVERSLALVKVGLFENERVVNLVTLPVAPAVDHRRKDELGIKELVESAKTSYVTAVPEKKFNINLAASRLNGVVVPPGSTFSFNKEVGPTTLKAGYKWGYGIKQTGSRVTTVPSVAGGICQVATTLFQAVFWGGYEIGTRRPHSYWIPAYTSRGIVGLDTTVDEPSALDFKFTNTTSTFVLIRARTEGSSVIFSLYGKKPGWKVEVGKPTVSRVVPALTSKTTEENPNLEFGKQIQAQAAREGFDVTVVRKVREAGPVADPESGAAKVRTLQVKSRYVPTGTVVMVGTKGKPPSAR